MITNTCKVHAGFGKGRCPGCSLADWVQEEISAIEADKRYEGEIDPTSKTPLTLEQVSLRASVRVLMQVKRFIELPKDE